MTQSCTQRVDVAASILPSEVLLRRRVAGSHHARSDLFGHELSRNSEIDENNTTIRSEHQVTRLEVTINDWLVLSVQIFENFSALNSNANNQIIIQRSISID